MKRIVTSIALALFALYTIFWAPLWFFIAVVALIAALCYHEYQDIAVASGVEGALWLGYPGGLLAIAWPDMLPALVMAAMIAAILTPDLRKSLGLAASLVLGIVYIFIAWGWAIPLRITSPFWIFFALSITWVGDIAAYYVGRSFGKHKLARRISPGKSWEGAIGALIAATVYGTVYGTQFDLGLDASQMLLLSALANIAGQIGDLAESALKRGAGVKDSGTLLPGHGGFLDRLDSSLFTLPLVYYYLRFTGIIAGS